MSNPHELLRTGFLKSLNTVIPCHRHSLTEAILRCVDPDDDNTEAVYKLHKCMQQNSEFAGALLRVKLPAEVLSAIEFVKLVSFLESRSEFELHKFAAKGMKELVRTQE